MIRIIRSGSAPDQMFNKLNIIDILWFSEETTAHFIQQLKYFVLILVKAVFWLN